MKKIFDCVGIDEVGRGAWAGPLVACALVLKTGERTVSGVRDSKMLRPDRRSSLSIVLRSRHRFGIGIATIEELNTLGITTSQILAYDRALKELMSTTDIRMRPITIDGLPVHSRPQWSAVVDGDQKIYSIAAASIVAKVARDAMMVDLHASDQRYRFDLHKGYGTELHQQRLEQYGPSIHHRKLFEPIRKLYTIPVVNPADL